MKILTVKEIIKEYNMPRDLVYQILKRPKCPIISGKRGKMYRIERQAFEEFMRKGA